MEETSKQCQWRGCEEEGHSHRAVTFKVFMAQVGAIYLCPKHCEKARLTGHIDIQISQIKMIER